MFISALRDGRFQVYAVAHADEAMELLCGRKAGRMRNTGEFPTKTLNGRVQGQLTQFARLRMVFPRGHMSQLH